MLRYHIPEHPQGNISLQAVSQSEAASKASGIGPEDFSRILNQKFLESKTISQITPDFFLLLVSGPCKCKCLREETVS